MPQGTTNIKYEFMPFGIAIQCKVDFLKNGQKMQMYIHTHRSFFLASFQCFSLLFNLSFCIFSHILYLPAYIFIFHHSIYLSAFFVLHNSIFIFLCFLILYLYISLFDYLFCSQYITLSLFSSVFLYIYFKNVLVF